MKTIEIDENTLDVELRLSSCELRYIHDALQNEKLKLCELDSYATSTICSLCFGIKNIDKELTNLLLGDIMTENFEGWLDIDTDEIEGHPWVNLIL